METLYTLHNFTKKYPQIKKNELQYAFTGGTAIRLIQEKLKTLDKREISDFDLIVFENGKYPVHNFNMKQKLLPIEKEEFKEYLESVKINKDKYFFMNGSFLTLSKTCAIDTPREKDYKDIKLLHNYKEINEQKLKGLFKKSNLLTENSKLALDVFYSTMENANTLNIHKFQCFRHYVNLMDEFNSKKKANKILMNYLEKDKEKSGYSLSSIMHNSISLMRELKEINEKDKLEFLENLLKTAEYNDHIDFDLRTHQEYLPKLRYSKSKEENLKEILESKF